MGSCRAIYNDIAASTSVFFRPRQKNSLGQGRALGNFFASDEKKPRSRGYIVVYSPPRPHIYITYIKYNMHLYIKRPILYLPVPFLKTINFV